MYPGVPKIMINEEQAWERAPPHRYQGLSDLAYSGLTYEGKYPHEKKGKQEAASTRIIFSVQ